MFGIQAYDCVKTSCLIFMKINLYLCNGIIKKK